MVELIFRLIPGDTRHKKAQEYFSCDLVYSAFCEITSPEFEAVSMQIIYRAMNYFRISLWLGLCRCLYKPFWRYTLRRMKRDWELHAQKQTYLGQEKMAVWCEGCQILNSQQIVVFQPASKSCTGLLMGRQFPTSRRCQRTSQNTEDFGA